MNSRWLSLFGCLAIIVSLQLTACGDEVIVTTGGTTTGTTAGTTSTSGTTTGTTAGTTSTSGTTTGTTAGTTSTSGTTTGTTAGTTSTSGTTTGTTAGTTSTSGTTAGTTSGTTSGTPPALTLSFAAPTDYSIGGLKTSSNSLATADLNKDGKFDLVALNNGALYFLVGKGDGTFESPIVLMNDSMMNNLFKFNARGLTIGDLDQDGTPEVLISKGINPVSLYQFEWDGTQLALTQRDSMINKEAGGITLLTPTQAAIAVADGFLIYDQGSNSFTAHDSAIDPMVEPKEIVSDDFDGNGKPDIAYRQNLGGDIILWLADNSGVLAVSGRKVFNVTGSTDLRGLIAKDLNSDGKTDLITGDVTNKTGVVLISKGDGTFTQVSHPTAAITSEAVAVGDLNKDNKLDLVVINAFGPFDANMVNPATVNIFKGNGLFGMNQDGFDVTSDPVQVITTYGMVGQEKHARTGVIADFNNDGLPDIAVASDFNGPAVTVFLNTSN